MYFNVVIHEVEECMPGNYLVFHFGNNLEKAKKHFNEGSEKK